MSIIEHSETNYSIIEADDGDASALAARVDTWLNTGSWLCAGGLVVKQNGNIAQALIKKTLI